MGEKLLERIEDMLPNLIAAVIIILAGHILAKITLRIMAKGLSVKHVDVTVHKFLMSTVRVVIGVSTSRAWRVSAVRGDNGAVGA